MSNQVSTAFVKQFGSNVDMLVQQKGSRLMNAVRRETIRGEQAFFDQIGATEAVEVTDRHGDSPLINTPHSRRRVTPVDVEWGDLIDDFDKLKMLMDPESAYALNAGWAVGRKIDDIIIRNIFAAAATGKDGSSSTSFPAGNQVAADFDGDGTDEGLTVEKLREARRLLRANEVPEDEPMFIACTAKQLDDLLGTTEVTSSDFNTVKALVQGDIDTYMGFKFIHTERLETDSSSLRRVPVWSMNGLLLAVAKDPTVRVTERADKRFSQYVYYMTSVGSTRMEEDRVIEIKCAE